jgi:hypothetical protein
MTHDTKKDLAENGALPEIAEAEHEVSEVELDDDDYMPYFIKCVLENPPVLPNEKPGEFVLLFEQFEYSHLGRAKTVAEYTIVFNATTLTWELMRYHRMKVAILLNHQRGAVESLFRKTHEGASMAGAESGLRAMASVNADQWFGDAAYRARAAKLFEAAGYASNAVEAEAFQRSLPTLATIDRLIASAQKRLTSFLKDLERRYGSRASEMRLVAIQAVSRASGEKE